MGHVSWDVSYVYIKLLFKLLLVSYVYIKLLSLIPMKTGRAYFRLASEISAEIIT